MKKLIVANWKMYLGLRESIALAKKVSSEASRLRSKNHISMVLCPSFVALEEVAKVVHGTRIKLGAQNVDPERSGAFTGEVGLDDLRSLRVEYVLVGHSERRRMGEIDALVNKKLKAVLKGGMRPILCVGEPTRPNFSRGKVSVGQGSAKRYVAKQLRAGLKGVAKKDMRRIVIAYEPVWAISGGKNSHPDTPEDASMMHMFISKIVGDIFIFQRKNKDVPIPILYGGSVNAKNASAFLRAPGVDGLLIGRASTRSAEFLKVIKQASV